MKRPVAVLAVLAALAAPALALDGDTQLIDWEQLRAQAVALRERVAILRADADDKRAAAERKCLDAFFMASCTDAARKEHQDAQQAARTIELEAIGIEKRLRARDYEVRRLELKDKNLRREEKAAERAEKIRQEEERRRIEDEERTAKAAERRERSRRE